MLRKPHHPKGEIIFREEFLGAVGKVQGNARLPGGNRGRNVSGHTRLCRNSLLWGLTLFCKSLRKQPRGRILFGCFMPVGGKRSPWRWKWQNHDTFFLCFLLSQHLLPAAVLCTSQVFCRTHLMIQDSEIWLGRGHFCRWLNLSVGLVVVWASV